MTHNPEDRPTSPRSGSAGPSISEDEGLFRSGFTRRGFITAAGMLGAGALGGSLIAPAAAAASPVPRPASDATRGANPVATPRVNGLHLQYGRDASAHVVVSWHTLQPVTKPRVLLGDAGGQYLSSAVAYRSTYTDAQSGQIVYAWHAELTGLDAGREYIYAAVHQGAEPEFGSFRTAPRGRSPFTFTSFGDQGTPTTGAYLRATRGRDDPQPAVRQRQPRFTLGQRHDRGRRTGAAAVPSLQRRPLLRQPGRRPGPDVERLLGEQQSQRAVPPVDAIAG